MKEVQIPVTTILKVIDLLNHAPAGHDEPDRSTMIAILRRAVASSNPSMDLRRARILQMLRSVGFIPQSGDGRFICNEDQLVKFFDLAQQDLAQQVVPQTKMYWDKKIGDESTTTPIRPARGTCKNCGQPVTRDQACRLFNGECYHVLCGERC
jgi:hypothetical protein